MGHAHDRALAFLECGRAGLRCGAARLRLHEILKRILVIRGGAIGDFVLTLPAIKLLRENFPQSHIEILGYRHIVALAEKRFYADAARSIEYGALASFFARDAELPAELANYFEGFDLVLSYLFDPDEIFATNLRRAGVEELIVGPAKLNQREHAARQLARPLEQLDLILRNPAAEIFPKAEDDAAAAQYLPRDSRQIIAIHPGSGSTKKNWPLEKWVELGRSLTTAHLIVMGGEADAVATERLRAAWSNLSVTYAENQPLTTVAAILARVHRFIGHDSGISHIAAAVGAPCSLLFGASDPEIWAPQNPKVRVVRPESRQLDDVSVEEILATLTS
jgi:heptosyltransferase-2